MSQHAQCPSGAPLLPPIANGVATEDFGGGSHARRHFALMLGRICPEKGQHLAIDAAKKAGIPLLLGGAVFPYPAHETYFAREVLPRLDTNRRFMGPLSLTRKRRWLAAARCLLIPSLVPETSSLAAMEALASGTPVIAFGTGALPEIVEHGETGFLVDGTDEMANAIALAGSIDPARCRRAARERFCGRRMAAEYLGRFAALAA